MKEEIAKIAREVVEGPETQRVEIHQLKMLAAIGETIGVLAEQVERIADQLESAEKKSRPAWKPRDR